MVLPAIKIGLSSIHFQGQRNSNSGKDLQDYLCINQLKFHEVAFTILSNEVMAQGQENTAGNIFSPLCKVILYYPQQIIRKPPF